MTDIGNTYNHDTNFSDVFQWAFFYPEEAGPDWIYEKHVYVAIEKHRGGDVRGNYGRVQLYGPVDAPRLYDMQLSWDVRHLNDEPVADADHFEAGYHQCPLSHLMKQLKQKPGRWEGTTQVAVQPRWSEKLQCYLARHKDGYTIKIKPFFY